MFSWDCHTTRSASMLYLHMWCLDLLFCQNCVVVIEKSVALCVWTSMPIISILFFEIFPYIYLYLILLQRSWQVFFSITPERFIYKIISTSSIPVTADDFPLSSFCWICFCLESCWMCYVGWFTSFSLPLFFEADILTLGGILFLVLHNCSILIDHKQ